MPSGGTGTAGAASGQVRAGSEWLTLREPADAAARSTELIAELLRYLPARDLVVHDLGCGTGSMTRWLAPRLPRPAHWILHDRDAALLNRVEPEHQTRLDDVTRLAPQDLADADLVTASALLDMMTAAELERFVDACSSIRCPVLITLSVVGRVELDPVDPLDTDFQDAFNDHQRRETTGGRLLGPDAFRAAVTAFTARGRNVVVRPSPWRLDTDHPELLAEWLTGWLAAATEQRPGLATRDYARRRLAEAARASLTVTVHHEDLLVRPSA
ncbi:MAG: class I SAM-dependent methyltransferase [Nocardioides sp.]